MATRAAMGFQSALVTCSPKAMATVIANGTARRTANAITCSVSGTGSMESGIRFWAGDLEVNRQASLCDEFGGAQSSK